MPGGILRGQVINEKLMAVSLASIPQKNTTQKIVGHYMVLKDCDHDVAIKLANNKNLKNEQYLQLSEISLNCQIDEQVRE